MMRQIQSGSLPDIQFRNEEALRIYSPLSLTLVRQDCLVL